MAILEFHEYLVDDEVVQYFWPKSSHPVKKDLNKKLDPKQKTIQAFNIDA